jgi:hypothetical protein
MISLSTAALTVLIQSEGRRPSPHPTHIAYAEQVENVIPPIPNPCPVLAAGTSGAPQGFVSRAARSDFDADDEGTAARVPHDQGMGEVGSARGWRDARMRRGWLDEGPQRSPWPASAPFSSLGRIRRPASLRSRRSLLFGMCWIRSATPARSAPPNPVRCSHQRAADVPSPPSICRPMSAIAF